MVRPKHVNWSTTGAGRLLIRRNLTHGYGGSPLVIDTGAAVSPVCSPDRRKSRFDIEIVLTVSVRRRSQEIDTMYNSIDRRLI